MKRYIKADYYDNDEDEKERMMECPECGKLVKKDDMVWTSDYYGIPFRLVCYDCYNKIMDEKGYDGEYYTEQDENLDWDY